MHNFEKLIFWQKSLLLAKNIYLISAEIPSDEKFGIISQIKRASVSIPSNIAEGSSRTSNKEFSYFLSVALGSAYELQTQLLLIRELKIINHEKISNLLSDVSEIQKMIFAFKNNLK